MISAHLNLTASNATCHLFHQGIVLFKQLNLDTLFADTAIYPMYQEGIFKKEVKIDNRVGYDKKMLNTVNFSDAIRLALIYKFGGTWPMSKL